MENNPHSHEENQTAPAPRPRRRLTFRSGALALLLALGVTGAVIIGRKLFIDQIVPRRWVEVEPGKLYRSGQVSPRLIRDVLEKHKIQVIVDLTAPDHRNEAQQREDRVAKELGIEHIRLPLRGDGTGDVGHYVAAVAAIVRAHRENKPVLVHCGAGIMRTGGVIAAYQLLVQHRPPAIVYQDLLDHCQDPVTGPALIKYLNDHMAEIATDLVKMGVIDRLPLPVPTLGPASSARGCGRRRFV
ncbi:MAG: dual specificity protein phosphatase family protein [Planctomycetes bacterium]|nr:dual specificity protein phosphatase family protein [Planctomycetota bacterium]